MKIVLNMILGLILGYIAVGFFPITHVMFWVIIILGSLAISKLIKKLP